ncbi:hypothetical protein HH213_17925 [Duganella dendranthematis]|uniref:Uncharacterized protein n=1 Tax=Duganella dendranthematis TaxID=2728021 RepID=A0ABX6MCD6_9BURK|nr:hypothetical protein [Duganella dendranthematis]QJD91801.1 hypothetical protein HH213_17925 [Duganella dendranthematis]
MIDWDALVIGPCVGVFGEPVIFTPVGGDPVEIDLVYDEGNKDVALAGGTPLNSSNPIVSGQMSVFPVEPQTGDRILIKGTGEEFAVSDVDDDGKGGVVLSLNYVGPGL